MDMNLDATIKQFQTEISEAIVAYLPPINTHPSLIHEAMLYSMLSGGKRLRPILLLTGYDLFPSDNDPLPAAVAIECLHTYSLIHDDLPAMDNSDLRRGAPSSHKKFDEATAILAGDALLTYAFELLSHEYNNLPKTAIDLVKMLSNAAGSKHLVGGQLEDLNPLKTPSNAQRLEYIHKNKTSAIISTSLCMGLRLGETKTEKLELAQELGYHIGMAFQIIDDILDITQTSEELGKTTSLDLDNDTLTYPKFYGIEKSQINAQEHTEKALELCEKIGGENEFLLQLVGRLEHRLA